MTPLEFPAGRVLTHFNEVGREFFVITSGSASVTRGDEVLAHVGRGSFFGEMALLDGGRRTATVAADTTMEAFVLSEHEFTALLRQSPTVAHNLLRAMSQRLRAA
jgi:voltage-gated potassium channel